MKSPSAQRAPAAAERLLADRVEDHVVALAVPREVLPLPVDDDVRAERPDQLDALRVETAVTCAPVAFASCTAGRADRAGGAVHEDVLPRAELRPREARARDARTVATAAASSKLRPAGLCASAPASRTQTYSAFAPVGAPKTSSPTANSVDRRAHRLDHSRELHAEDRLLRPRRPVRSWRRRARRREAGVRPVDGRGVNPHSTSLSSERPRDLLDSQDLRRPVTASTTAFMLLLSSVRCR